jgi:Zn-dependent alcohol dehydrogenase
MRSLASTAGSSLLILGGGAMALSAVMEAIVQGCGTTFVLEPYEARRNLALELGATHVIDPAKAPTWPPPCAPWLRPVSTTTYSETAAGNDRVWKRSRTLCWSTASLIRKTADASLTCQAIDLHPAIVPL